MVAIFLSDDEIEEEELLLLLVLDDLLGCDGFSRPSSSVAIVDFGFLFFFFLVVVEVDSLAEDITLPSIYILEPLFVAEAWSVLLLLLFVLLPLPLLVRLALRGLVGSSRTLPYFGLEDLVDEEILEGANEEDRSESSCSYLCWLRVSGVDPENADEYPELELKLGDRSDIREAVEVGNVLGNVLATFCCLMCSCSTPPNNMELSSLYPILLLSYTCKYN